MLILARRPEEGIVIDGTIRIYFLGMNGGAAKIGVDAPPHIEILREELTNGNAITHPADNRAKRQRAKRKVLERAIALHNLWQDLSISSSFELRRRVANLCDAVDELEELD